MRIGLKSSKKIERDEEVNRRNTECDWNVLGTCGIFKRKTRYVWRRIYDKLVTDMDVSVMKLNKLAPEILKGTKITSNL